MTISFVVAASDNNAIGKNNELLWHLPNDLKFFKNLTWAMPCAMGRRTFQALENKPLKGRFNIIITRNKDYKVEGAVVVNSIDDAIFLAQQQDYNELMIIGGGEIYKAALPKADKIYLTRVHAVFENADTFFPDLDPKKWELSERKDYFKDDRHAYDYSFETWERK